MGKRYQYGDEVLDFIKGGKPLHGIVKSVHRKLLSSTEENVRILTVWRVPYCLANLVGETCSGKNRSLCPCIFHFTLIDIYVY